MSNNEIIIEAKRLIDRIRAEFPDFIGETASESEIAKLESELKLKLPKWFTELYTNVPIINAEFGVQEFEPEEDFDGISYIILGSVDDIIEESNNYEPGKSAIKEGFVFIASCSHGSGDPIFINMTSEEPKVFRIYHDDFTKVQLGENLTSLFKNAIL